MTTLTLPRPRAVAAAPLPMLWTCEEFHRCGDMGMFEGRRAMLIDGVIFEEGPMNNPHAVALGLLELAVQAAFGPGWWFRHQAPLVLGRRTDPQPDLAVVPGHPRDYKSHPTTANLVVEVSDTSYSFDTGEKRVIYATAGIADYWVLDINGQRLLVYRDPSVGDYATQLTLGPTDTIAPLAKPSAVIRVADLLP